MKHFIYLLLFVLLFNNGYSQQMDEHNDRFRSIDSLKIIFYKDSLGFDAKTIRKMLELRDYFYQQSGLIASDTSINNEVRERRIKVVRKNYMKSLHNLLGEIKYNAYLNMVDQRIKAVNMTYKPLASDN